MKYRKTTTHLEKWCVPVWFCIKKQRLFVRAITWTAAISDGSKISALDNLAMIHSVEEAEESFGESK